METDDTFGRSGDGERGWGLVVPVVVVLATLGMTVPFVVPVAGQADTVTLTVTVVNEAGDPVSNAEVTATWDSGSVRQTTAGNGKVFLDVRSGASVTFTVDHPDYVRNRPFTATRSEDGEVTIPVSSTARFSVVAVDDAGERLEGVTVAVVRKGRTVARGQTGADGRYSTGDIEAGTYEISLSKPGYFTRRLTPDLGGSVTRQLALRTGTVEYRFVVRDDHFDPPRPVANATVEVGSVGSVRTLADGRGSIGVPVNTEQEVRVTKPGYQSVTRRVQVGESPANVTLTARSRRVVVGERVTVEARDAYGDPIEGATVLLDGSSVGTTGADGTLAVPIEERGSHELRARRNALTSDPVSVEGVVPAGTETATAAGTPTPTDDAGTASGLAPGFGAGSAVVALALLATAGLVARRRR